MGDFWLGQFVSAQGFQIWPVEILGGEKLSTLPVGGKIFQHRREGLIFVPRKMAGGKPGGENFSTPPVGGKIF